MKAGYALRLGRWTAALVGVPTLITFVLTLFCPPTAGESGIIWFIPALYASYPAAFIIRIFDARSSGLIATDLACGGVASALLVVLVNSALGGIVGFAIGRWIAHDNDVVS